MTHLICYAAGGQCPMILRQREGINFTHTVQCITIYRLYEDMPEDIRQLVYILTNVS